MPGFHVVEACDCSDHQLDAVGCECGGTPRHRPSVMEMLEQQDRVANALIEKALDREHRAEMAYYESERERIEALGWNWDPSWGEQPFDQHVRAMLAERDARDAKRAAA